MPTALLVLGIFSAAIAWTGPGWSVEASSGDPRPTPSGGGGMPPPRPTPTPSPRTLPTDPFVSKRCVGPNPDGTVSQVQDATCTIYVDSGGHPYIAGDRLRITAASPIGVTSCEGWVDETYYTAAVLSTSGDQCGYRILSGTTRQGAILGTEVISIPNTVPSGTQIQQTVLFCSAPGADGEGVCRAVPNSIPVT